ncbi:MAG TPA: adenosylcobinamide amidohydrolase [Methanocella sp.]|nr:adenosylcobinamide amidohydrolase [Methanocella sp.]
MKDHTLVIRGDFDGVSTGLNGGRARVRSVINHQVGRDFDDRRPAQYLDRVAESVGADFPYFGFMTAVAMKNLCVVRDLLVTAFVTAGISNPCHDPGVPGTINVILVVRGRLSEGALGGAIVTATEAKAKALFEMGFDFTGTTTDAVAVLAEAAPMGACAVPFHEYAGTATPLGQSIYRCVKKGVAEGIRRQHGTGEGGSSPGASQARLFVLAQRDTGFYWIAKPDRHMGKGKCPHYPCHFEGQVCTYCYCPLYPCEDPELGKWIVSRRGPPVWTCKDCALLHERKVAAYLKKHPEAGVEVLKRLAGG